MQSFEAFRSAWEEQIFDDFPLEIPWKQDILGTANNWQILVWVNTYRYIFSGMNIHLPAILGFTRYQGFDPSPYCQCKLNYTSFFKLRVVQARQKNHPAVRNADCAFLFVSFQKRFSDGSRWIHGFASNSNGSTMINPIIRYNKRIKRFETCFFCPRVAGSPQFAHEICWIVKLIHQGSTKEQEPLHSPGTAFAGSIWKWRTRNFNGLSWIIMIFYVKWQFWWYTTRIH